MVGNIVGNYKILEQIGEGGMGAVYKGVDLMLEREVAIKALRPELARQPQIVERFRAEAVTLAKLNHPNIATLHSFFRQGDDFFMVMEFVRGETLDSLLRRSGGMTCDRAVPLFCQALEGIDHAHRLGIIHRDIKPANMMLTATPPVPGAVATGSIKVMDFGIARVLGTARMTRQGNIIGTIEYMSPEQVRGQETDARSDIYSLGILLYEMLTGRVPFHSDSEFELMKSQIDDPPPPPTDFAPHISQLIEQAIMRALAKNPEARFQSAGALRAALLNSLNADRSAQQSTVGMTDPMIVAGPSIPLAMGIPPGNTGARGPASGDGMPFTGQGPVSPGSAEHIKATRLATGDGSVKETRLSPGDYGPGAVLGYPAQPQQYGHPQPGLPQYGQPSAYAAQAGGYPGHPAAYAGQQAGQGASLLSKLTWKHYAGAGVALMVVLVGGVLALIGFSGKQTPTQPPANTSTRSQGGSAPAAQAPQADQAAPATDQPNLGPPPDTDPAAKSAAAGSASGSSKRRGSDAGASSSSASSGSAGSPAGETGGSSSSGTTARESSGSSHRAGGGTPPRQPAQREADPPKEGKAAKVGGFLKKVGGLLQKKP